MLRAHGHKGVWVLPRAGDDPAWNEGLTTGCPGAAVVLRGHVRSGPWAEAVARCLCWGGSCQASVEDGQEAAWSGGLEVPPGSQGSGGPAPSASRANRAAPGLGLPSNLDVSDNPR